MPTGPLVSEMVKAAAAEFAKAHVLAPLLATLITTTFVWVGSNPLAVHVVGDVDGVVRRPLVQGNSSSNPPGRSPRCIPLAPALRPKRL